MKRGSIFETDGIPHMSEALPLAMQHVVARSLAVSHRRSSFPEQFQADSPEKTQVFLIQSALVIAALSTLLQLFPIGGKANLQLAQACLLSWVSALLTCQVCRR